VGHTFIFYCPDLSASQTDKETWEPTIERIFEVQNGKSVTDARNRIREAWSFDWQSHGDAAVLNKIALETEYASDGVCEWNILRLLSMRHFRDIYSRNRLVAGDRYVPEIRSHGGSPDCWNRAFSRRKHDVRTRPILIRQFTDDKRLAM